MSGTTRIVLLTADGIGTKATTRAVGKDKTVVWGAGSSASCNEGITALTCDKPRPAPPLPAETVDRDGADQLSAAL